MLSSNPIINFLLQVVTLRGSFNWQYVWQYLFATLIWQGVIITVIFSVLSQLLGTIIGLILYFMRRSRSSFVRRFVEGYIWFFRGTPLLVQILFLNEILPYLNLATPLINTHLFRHLGFTGDIALDAFLSTCAALSFNEGAYMAEIVRAGIDAIDLGQMEAAKSLGMTYWQGMRRIVLPQALRVIVPPLGNEFNSMLKNSALAYVIGVGEIMSNVKLYASAFGAPMEFYVIASIWYLALTTAWGFVQSWIERKLSASYRDPGMQTPSWWQRAIGFGRREATSDVPVPEAAGGVGDRR